MDIRHPPIFKKLLTIHILCEFNYNFKFTIWLSLLVGLMKCCLAVSSEENWIRIAASVERVCLAKSDWILTPNTTTLDHVNRCFWLSFILSTPLFVAKQFLKFIMAVCGVKIEAVLFDFIWFRLGSLLSCSHVHLERLLFTSIGVPDLLVILKGQFIVLLEFGKRKLSFL